jgi:hypothetical protein
MRDFAVFDKLHDSVRAAGVLRFLGILASERGDLVKARQFMELGLTANRETKRQDLSQ